MKRLIVELLLVVALGAAGFFAWTNQKSGAVSSTKLAEMTAQAEAADKKLIETTTALEEATEALGPLQIKGQELDAVKAALAGGELLKDLEAAYKKEKSLSTDKQLGLAALRLLTNGSKDPATVEAFKKTLEMADWSGRKKVICAAQNALAAAGEKVAVLSECAPAVAKGGDEKGDAKDAGHGAKDERTASADGHGKPEKGGKGKGKGKDAHAAPHWDYEGAMGPENWGKEFPTCAKGKSQSPLNIKGPFEKALFAVAPDYKPGQLRIVNNGHTIQVNVNPGSKLRIDSMPFDLLQFHFHRPSEELIDGKPAAMVVHFVHKNAEGRLAVLGVMLKEGNENPGIKALWAHAPAKEGPEVQPDGVMFNPANLLPREYEFYSYEGSLTTPPCTEGVRFFILKSQVNISRDQVEQFPFKKNARPVQPQNGRAIAG